MYTTGKKSKGFKTKAGWRRASDMYQPPPTKCPYDVYWADCVSKDIDSILASNHAIFRKNHQKTPRESKGKSKKKNHRDRLGLSKRSQCPSQVGPCHLHPHRISGLRDFHPMQTIFSQWFRGSPSSPPITLGVRPSWNRTCSCSDELGPDRPSHPRNYHQWVSFIFCIIFILTQDPSFPRYLPSPSRGCCYTCATETHVSPTALHTKFTGQWSRHIPREFTYRISTRPRVPVCLPSMYSSVSRSRTFM